MVSIAISQPFFNFKSRPSSIVQYGTNFPNYKIACLKPGKQLKTPELREHLSNKSFIWGITLFVSV